MPAPWTFHLSLSRGAAARPRWLAGLWVVLVIVGALTGRAKAGERWIEVYEARVSRVFDGDTLWVKPLAGGRYRKLRLEGLDAPEICQPGGEPSRDVLAQRVLQQVVTVQVSGFDDYGRALARVQQAGEDVGALLVAQGHAWSSRYRSASGSYAVQQAQAQAFGLGLFADPKAEEPRDFRRRHGPCPMPPRP
jgi:micrococcal nuclease